jgi:peptide/nickel transport system ATP-binding protein
MSLLDVQNLTVSTEGTTLVDNISFSLDRGQRLGIIGESGSGKTLTALAILGLLADSLSASGSVMLDGEQLLGIGEDSMCAVRGDNISMVFQEPMTALNPVMRIGRQVAEPLRLHRGLDTDDAINRAIELLDSVGIEHPERRARSYPHELSGGQRQRAMIAMALACGPDLVIADEPTTALDVTVQAQVLSVLRDQVLAHHTALILITHDLPVVASMTDNVIVMRDGAVVDRGTTSAVFEGTSNNYTAALVASVPPMSRSAKAEGKPAGPQPTGSPIIRVRDLHREYRLRRTSLLESRPVIKALDGVSVDIHPGETFGIVGESGSGKSTLARMIVGLDRPTSGEVNVDGIDVSSGRDLRPLRDVAQMVFQDPMGSLDPRMRIGDVIAEPLRSLGIDGDHPARVASLLQAVSLPTNIVERYPHEFSGGQRQRIAIARALAPGPRLLVADEPVSALDMSVQTVTLELLQDLKEQFDLTMVFISHDLSVVHEICERVIVLEYGRIVEEGPVGTVFGSPKQPYTRTLVHAIPRMDGSFLTSSN